MARYSKVGTVRGKGGAKANRSAAQKAASVRNLDQARRRRRAAMGAAGVGLVAVGLSRGRILRRGGARALSRGPARRAIGMGTRRVRGRTRVASSRLSSGGQYKRFRR
jgi:hypothetical protein